MIEWKTYYPFFCQILELAKTLVIVSKCVGVQTPEEDNAYLDLRQENDDLLRRLAEVQQQMWTLEEKVMSSASR